MTWQSLYRDLRDVQLRTSLEAEHGIFIAEGAKVIERALAAGYEPHSFLMTEKWLGSVPGDTGAPIHVLTDAEMQDITGFEVHRGALAAFRRKPLPDAADLLTDARTVVVLEDIVDHTNVGAILRSAAALGVDAALLAPRCADPLYRRSVKVSMGAVFSLPWTYLADWHGAMPLLTGRGFTTVALTLAEDATPMEGAVAGLDRVALVLGSEGHGLSPRWQASADRRAIIPMHHGIDSLNVAAAAALACWITARR